MAQRKMLHYRFVVIVYITNIAKRLRRDAIAIPAFYSHSYPENAI